MFMQNRMPIDYILTVHRTNYDVTFGKGSFDLTVTSTYQLCPIVINLFNTYGRSKVIHFVTEVVNAKTSIDRLRA